MRRVRPSANRKAGVLPLANGQLSLSHPPQGGVFSYPKMHHEIVKAAQQVHPLPRLPWPALRLKPALRRYRNWRQTPVPEPPTR
jgi:hypothetical protein